MAKQNDTVQRQQGTLTLRATVTADRQHDLEKYLQDLERQFANNFSIGVHEFYPDAKVGTFVEIEDI